MHPYQSNLNSLQPPVPKFFHLRIYRVPEGVATLKSKREHQTLMPLKSFKRINFGRREEWVKESERDEKCTWITKNWSLSDPQFLPQDKIQDLLVWQTPWSPFLSDLVLPSPLQAGISGHTGSRKRGSGPINSYRESGLSYRVNCTKAVPSSTICNTGGLGHFPTLSTRGRYSPLCASISSL